MKSAGNGKTYNTFSLISSNRDLSCRFADFIYNNATIYLDYKYKISHKLSDIIKNSILFGSCPKCESSNIIKNGTRGGKYRLKCKDCNSNFTRPMPTQQVIVDE